ncbi:hypothetical protein DespoDRAFT_00983 [Desulfobacter postgatei 2ac9]|uniref:Uncharacterized protein n=1 Tax=Desulfobacter postgatei 2ac9 TaxID=879212 RepID=I5B0E6_9BACT|nr:hypothetical protein DespoDRAFT_00983 [Desulfobacter postgatei 2ac9]
MNKAIGVHSCLFVVPTFSVFSVVKNGGTA